MTTPKQAAALALAEAYCVHYHDHLGQGEEEQNALDDAATAYERTRTQPDAPDLTALERDYLEACYAFDVDVAEGRECGVGTPRLRAAYQALHAARTAQADPLVEARKLLVQYATNFDASTEQFDALAAITNKIDDALAQRKEKQ